MRLPLSKVWRGFPELDGFSDEQCAAYVRLARERQLEHGGIIVANAAIIAVGFVVIMVVGEGMMHTSRLMSDEVQILLMVMGAVGVPSVTALWIRDAWLRRAVRRHLKSARCPACRYMLLGLPVREGAVRCPECGHLISLRAIGLTPADLISTAGATADSR